MEVSLSLCDNIFASSAGLAAPSFMYCTTAVPFLKCVPFPSLTEILQGPVSQLAPLNSEATFFCRATGDLVIWYVNGDPVDYRLMYHQE